MALHFVNLAPNLKYSANLSLKPSSPSVTFSSVEPASFFAPVSTLIPGTEPELLINSGIVFPEEVFCLSFHHKVSLHQYNFSYLLKKTKFL